MNLRLPSATAILLGLAIFVAAPALATEPAQGDAAATTGTASTTGTTNEGEDLPPVSTGHEQHDQAIGDMISEKIAEAFSVKASHGSKGFRLETTDGNWQTNLQWRFQFRLTNPFRSDPRQVVNFDRGQKDQTTFELRRVRMKIGGHGYRPWLKYYFEVDLQPTRATSGGSSDARVIDWRIDVAKYQEFGLRVGQWKIDYNRERVDSSGRQQFVERSIVNRTFTIDRQMGVSFRGRLNEGTPGDLVYAFGVFTGEGRGTQNNNNDMMYTGRLQWNFLGRDLALKQTDVERTEKPTGSLAIGAATNRGACTRWSSSGCGNLDGFTAAAAAAPGQFRIYQAVGEFAFKYQGLSIQKEFHWKRVIDRSRDKGDGARESNLYGLYAQVGYFFHEIWEDIPEELELAVRYAWLSEPNAVDLTEYNEREEYIVGANWFFAGHNNKLTLDYSYLTIDDDVLDRDPDDHRVRLQWDISF